MAATRHRGARRPPEFVKLLASRILIRCPGWRGSTRATRPTPGTRVRPARYGSPRSSRRSAPPISGSARFCYLFTADEHLDGDDPFPLQPPNEALDLPLGLPDDDRKNSLWRLQEHLLRRGSRRGRGGEMDLGPHRRFAARGLRLRSADRRARTRSPRWASTSSPPCSQPKGYAVSPAQRRYRVPLAGSSEPLWNTPPGGPFHYDAAAGDLSARLPLTDEAVIAKLAGMRQLNPSEARAAQDLYFLPRVDLASFAFLFPDLAAADRHLIQERDEAERWAYFRRHFALAHARCRLIAEHLSRHVARVTRWSPP